MQYRLENCKICCWNLKFGSSFFQFLQSMHCKRYKNFPAILPPFPKKLVHKMGKLFECFEILCLVLYPSSLKFHNGYCHTCSSFSATSRNKGIKKIVLNCPATISSAFSKFLKTGNSSLAAFNKEIACPNLFWIRWCRILSWTSPGEAFSQRVSSIPSSASSNSRSSFSIAALKENII